SGRLNCNVDRILEPEVQPRFGIDTNLFTFSDRLGTGAGTSASGGANGGALTATGGCADRSSECGPQTGSFCCLRALGGSGCRIGTCLEQVTLLSEENAVQLEFQLALPSNAPSGLDSGQFHVHFRTPWKYRLVINAYRVIQRSLKRF